MPRRPAPLRMLLALTLAAACGDPEGGESEGAGSSSSGQASAGTSTSSGDASTTTSDASGSDSSDATSSSTGDASEGSTTTITSGTSDSSGDAASDTDATTGADGLPPDCPRVEVMVAMGNVLNVRPTPSTAEAPIGKLANGAIVDALDLVDGEVVSGDPKWFEIDFEGQVGYISAVYAACTLEEPPELQPPAGFWLPLACGTTATVSQGNFGDFSHQGKAAYAFDFAVGLGTPLVAIADGIVLHTYNQTKPGDPCYTGGGPECYAYANLVVLLHGDGSTSLYKHLNEVLVGDGEFVPRGEAVGLSGSTGYSTGRHAHVARQEDCGVANCQSIALEFVDAGVPKTGQSVTSKNCP
ncbi:MAG: peptidoglycan DD-metalloendopeptidase family protein [Myxococcales bacterium]|nr:peptidoglycan DD-metalloendopeptidase family protein [Myxococcales bacterium]MCB9566650.1 peptidoglycan DD-metalloendopeptidase family protein [Myxococcales bacterium]